MVITTRSVRRFSPRLAALQAEKVVLPLTVTKKAVVQRRKKTKRVVLAPNSKRSAKKAPQRKQQATKTTKAATKVVIHTNDAAPLGVIDPASGVTGRILTLQDGAPADAMLVLVDPSKNMDKYYVLQCIEETGSSTSSQYVVYTRWGRTGTKGQSLHQTFTTQAQATAMFHKKFVQKAGVTWAHRANTDSIRNKYRFIVQDFAEKQSNYSNATWQYYVDDGVDGKRIGWYDYTTEGSQGVERLYHEHAQNGSALTSRHVASGLFTYNVDLHRMTQTNVTHAAHTSRNIRRTVIAPILSTKSKQSSARPTPTRAPTTTPPRAATRRSGRRASVTPSP